MEQNIVFEGRKSQLVVDTRRGTVTFGDIPLLSRLISDQPDEAPEKPVSFVDKKAVAKELFSDESRGQTCAPKLRNNYSLNSHLSPHQFVKNVSRQARSKPEEQKFDFDAQQNRKRMAQSMKNISINRKMGQLTSPRKRKNLAAIIHESAVYCMGSPQGFFPHSNSKFLVVGSHHCCVK